MDNWKTSPRQHNMDSIFSQGTNEPQRRNKSAEVPYMLIRQSMDAVLFGGSQFSAQASRYELVCPNESRRGNRGTRFPSKIQALPSDNSHRSNIVTRTTPPSANVVNTASALLSKDMFQSRLDAMCAVYKEAVRARLTLDEKEPGLALCKPWDPIHILKAKSTQSVASKEDSGYESLTSTEYIPTFGIANTDVSPADAQELATISPGNVSQHTKLHGSLGELDPDTTSGQNTSAQVFEADYLSGTGSVFDELLECHSSDNCYGDLAFIQSYPIQSYITSPLKDTRLPKTVALSQGVSNTNEHVAMRNALDHMLLLFIADVQRILEGVCEGSDEDEYDDQTSETSSVTGDLRGDDRGATCRTHETTLCEAKDRPVNTTNRGTLAQNSGRMKQASPDSNDSNSTPTYSTNSTPATGSTGNLHQSSLGKRKAEGQGEDEEEEEGNSRKPRRNHPESRDDGKPPSTKRGLSCPYFKMKPEKFGSGRYWSCATPRTTTAKVKQHLKEIHYRNDMCHKCYCEIKSLQYLDMHLDSEACTKLTNQAIDEEMWLFWRSGRRSRVQEIPKKKKKESDAEHWKKIWHALFPGTKCPSPYPEVKLFEAKFNHDSQELILPILRNNWDDESQCEEVCLQIVDALKSRLWSWAQEFGSQRQQIQEQRPLNQGQTISTLPPHWGPNVDMQDVLHSGFEFSGTLAQALETSQDNHVAVHPVSLSDQRWLQQNEDLSYIRTDQPPSSHIIPGEFELDGSFDEQIEDETNASAANQYSGGFWVEED